MYITASKLYDFLQCPHRIWRDEYGPQDEKEEEANPFVKLLWEKGVQHETNIVASLGPLLDLSDGTLAERIVKTKKALEENVSLLYQPVIQAGDLLGIPDLLKHLGNGIYQPIDIKSGAGVEGVDEDEDNPGKPKKTYATQLCLYVDILIRNNHAIEKRGAIIDNTGQTITYELEQPMGVRISESWWQFYERTKNQVSALLQNSEQNQPALCGVCKLCPWYESCTKWCAEQDDITTIFYVGRKNRDVLQEDIGDMTVETVQNLNIQELLDHKNRDKNYLKGFGEKTLTSMVRRATILKTKKSPVFYSSLNLPTVSTELFFDIEDDPTQDFVYLHGVTERRNGKERYLHFLANNNTPKEEERAWAEFWTYIDSLPENDFSVYFYSHHEHTTYNRLFTRYPKVIAREKLDSFFENPKVIDLYKVVLQKTDWPTWNYSLKTLATYLGFHWRDETPSGALSIEWYNRYLESQDPSLLERILMYNEDDCRATLVLKDGLVKLDSQSH